MSNSPFDILLDKTAILEIAANGTVVGTLATSDADAGDTFTYELLDSAEGRFSLVNGNQIAVADNSKFNYQSAIFHTIKVKTTDSTGLSYEKDINIGLIDAKRNLVGYWKLDETTGTFDNASLVNANNDGTTVGSLNLGRPGQWNESVGFGDGIVSLGTNLLGYPAAENDPDGRRKFSVTAWIKPAKFDGLQTIFSTNSIKDKNNGFSLRLNSLDGNTRLNFYSVSTNTVLNYDLPSYPQIDPNTWFHVALVYENNSPTLYVNGTKLGSGQDFSLGSSDDSNLEYLIGAEDYTYYTLSSGDFLFSNFRFTGLIDEVKVYNSALSEAEITGVINETNFAPTDIGFYSNKTLISSTPDGSFIAALSATDNFLDDGKHTFSLIDDANGLVQLEGKNGLVLKDKTKIGDITGSFTDIPIKIRATDPLGNIFDKEFKLRFFAIDPRPDLLIYYKLDEESSDAQRAAVVDSTGNYREVGGLQLDNSGFYDGTKNPLTSLTSYGPIRGQDEVSGIADAGTSAKFSLGNYVTIPAGAVRFDKEFTVSVWVKPSSFNGTQGIFSADDDDNSGGSSLNRGFGVGLSGKRLYAYSYITGNSVVVDLPQSIFANEWFHVGASLSNNQITFYVNGVKLGSGYFDATKRPDAPISRTHLLGAERSGSNSTNAFTGLIDEFRFYTKSLSSNEILAVMEETNLAPSNIKISNNAITSSFTNGLVVGELEAVDSILDKGKHTYSLLDDAGGLFKISGNQILINDSSKFNGIDPEKLSIKVRATDPKGNTLDKTLPIELIFADPKANLVAYYKLNESSNESNRLFAIDSSGNNKNGVYNAGVVENVKTAGATRGELGIEGTSVSFNNWQDYINLGNQAITYNDQFTVSTWIRPTKLSGWQMVLAADDNGGGKGFGFGLMGKELAVINWENDAVFKLALPASITPDQWTHIALKYVGNQATLYLNGVALGSQSFTITKDSRNYLIGAGRANANDSNNFNGQIDDLRFYDVALADDKIKNLGNQPPSALELDNLSVVEYDANYPDTFNAVIGTLSTKDIGTDTHTYSLVENPNDIFTIENGQLVIAKPELVDYETTQSYDVVIRTTDTAGNSLDEKFTIQVIDTPDINKVAVFDGVNDYIKLPSKTSGGPFTFEAWVYTDEVNYAWQRIFDFGGDTFGQNNISLSFVGFPEDKGKLELRNLAPNGSYDLITTVDVFPSSQWVHVAAVVDENGEASLYWNGELKSVLWRGELKSSGNVGKITDVERSTRYLGQINLENQPTFKGKMDDVRIWDTARSAEEIQYNMSRTLSGAEPGLSEYYSFDIQKDQIAWDATGKNNDGSLINGASVLKEELPLKPRPPLTVSDLDGAIAEDFTKIEVPIFGKLSLDFIPKELSLFGDALSLWLSGEEPTNGGYLAQVLNDKLPDEFVIEDLGDGNYTLSYSKSLGAMSIPLSSNLGVSGFGLETQGSLIVDPVASFDFSFGYSTDWGAYINTDKSAFKIDISPTLSSDFKATGTLGFFQLDLANTSTAITANYTLEFADPDGSADDADGARLTLRELKDNGIADVLNSSLLFSPHVGLTAKTSFNGNPVLPSFDFGLDVNWKPTTYKDGQFSTGSIKPDSVEFKEVQLGLGTFITDVVRPVIDNVNKVIEPFRPVIRFATDDIPIFDQLGMKGLFDYNQDGNVTILDIANVFKVRILGQTAIDERFFKTLRAIDQVITTIADLANTPADQEIMVSLGDYTFDNLNPTLDDPFKNKKPVTAKVEAVSTDDALNKGTNSSYLSKAKNLVKSINAVEGLKFPILSDPMQAINLLTGQDNADLVTYDLPELNFVFDVAREFSIWGPLYGRLGGGFSATADLAFGYDTYGLNKWKNNGFTVETSLDTLDGFYVVAPPAPYNQLQLRAYVEAGFGLDVVIAAGYLIGGIEGKAGLRLLDKPNEEGEVDDKLRPSEIASRPFIDNFNLYFKRS